MIRYLRRNPSLVFGTALLVLLALFVTVGRCFIDPADGRPLSVPTLRPPSWDYPFGTDRQGRDLFAALVTGTPLTLKIGIIAGFLGVGIGTVLAFVAGYYRGLVDTLIRGVADIGLTVPGLLVLIIIAVSVRGGLTVNEMALVVASLAWLKPTRTIRAQVLTLRKRGYIEVARLSGMSGPLLVGSIPLVSTERDWLAQPVPAASGADDVAGCQFAARCPMVMPLCRSTPPPLFRTEKRRAVACHQYRDAPSLSPEAMASVFADGR